MILSVKVLFLSFQFFAKMKKMIVEIEDGNNK